MNHPPTPRPSRPSPRRKSGFTPQQIFILVLVALLGSAALILAAVTLLSPKSASPSPAPVSQSGPPTATSLPSAAAGATSGATSPANPPATPAPEQSLPALPVSCAQAGKGFSQGTVTQVIDESTLEVQVDGKSLKVGYAGIEIPPAPPQPSPEQKISEMLSGQPVLLVKDVSEQDSAGRLLRYVFAGDRFINFELVRQGLATVSPASPDRSCAAYLQQAEQQARAERLGLWGSVPVPTRTFVPMVTLDISTKTACDCSKRYVCSDFRTHAEAQTCFNACNDYSSKLDEDHNGIACENLP